MGHPLWPLYDLRLRTARLELRLPDEEEATYQTVAGLVMDQLRRIPKAADWFDIDDYRFEVVDMDGRRIDKVLASRLEKD